MKKRILTAIATISFALILVMSVAAAGAVATTDSKSCTVGETVTLNVNVSNVSNVASGAVEVIYDDSVLELVETEWHTDAMIEHFDYNENLGAFAFETSNNIGGNIFSVTFKVLDDAPIGKSTVECKIQLSTDSGKISVTNNSGYVDVTCKHSFDKKSDQYLASEASCTTPAKYYYSCSICGEKGKTTYTSGSTLPHTFDQQAATSAYLVTSVKCVNEAEYYYSCSICGAKGTEKFTADASWSHNFSDNWSNSEDGHWHECSDCGEKKDFANHTPNSDNVCDICNFAPSVDEPHNHSFGESWSKDKDSHWHECSECGEKKDLKSHDWKEGKCIVCGAEDPNYTAPAQPSIDKIMIIVIAIVILIAMILFLSLIS